MSTPSSRFRAIILDVIEDDFPEAVSLERLYTAAERRLVFDADDLIPPSLHGSPVKEPSWKRNLRNTLQHMKQAGALVNTRRDAWRLPSPDPSTELDEAAAWPLVRAAADMAVELGSEFSSPERGHRYRIARVLDGKIEVLRLDASRPESLTRGEVERAIRYLNSAGGRSGRRTLNYTVAKETSLVFLHPRLTWDSGSDSISVVGVSEVRPLYRDFGQAPDDDPEALSLFARRVRAGQPRFRRNLLRLYDGRCAVSGFGPEEVLEAAHIDPHAASGINHTDNGLLLRSDLHTLFDAGLLRIEPETLRVVLCPCLQDTPYWTHNRARLRPRQDASDPDQQYLYGRWEAARRPHGHGAAASARTSGLSWRRLWTLASDRGKCVRLSGQPNRCFT